jgi:hypothetical protein
LISKNCPKPSPKVSATSFRKWEEVGNDAIDTLLLIGLGTEPGGRRSIAKALFILLGEISSQQLIDAKKDS